MQTANYIYNTAICTNRISLCMCAYSLELNTLVGACRLVLVDAFALLYRAHFGMSTVRLTTGTGEDTSILFAVIRTVLTLMELEPPPTHFAVVFDAAGKTFRQAIMVPMNDIIECYTQHEHIMHGLKTA